MKRVIPGILHVNGNGRGTLWAIETVGLWYVLIRCANLVGHEVRAGSFLGKVPIELNPPSISQIKRVITGIVHVNGIGRGTSWAIETVGLWYARCAFLVGHEVRAGSFLGNVPIELNQPSISQIKRVITGILHVNGNGWGTLWAIETVGLWYDLIRCANQVGHEYRADPFSAMSRSNWIHRVLAG